MMLRLRANAVRPYAYKCWCGIGWKVYPVDTLSRL